MPVLNDADALFLGAVPVDGAYLAGRLVWSAVFRPPVIAGLAVWLDASQLGLAPGAAVSPWPDLSGAGRHGAVVGSPAPAVSVSTLNGLPVVRFRSDEGRHRWEGANAHSAHAEWTVVYVGRSAPGSLRQGRVLDAIYPPYNLLVGFWTTFQDVIYDGAFGSNGSSTPVTTDWKLYSADSTPADHSRLFSDGALLGTTASSGADGFGGTLALSGYGSTTAEETNDCEVAEVCLYNRKLSDVERQQVESYLRNKWLPARDPATNAYLAATGLPASYAPALDGLVVGLKTKGLWAKMKAVYPFIGGTAALHKWNLLDPRDADDAYRLTFTAGTGSHSTNLGYQPNAVGDYNTPGYADTHFVPSSTLALDSAHLSLYSLADRANAARCDMGSYNWDGVQTRFHIIARYTASEFYYSLTTAAVPNVPVPAASGMFVASRTSSAVMGAYRNGASLASINATATSLPYISTRIGGLSGYEREYSDLPLGFASIGTGLSALEVADLYAVVQAYQRSLGRDIT